MKTSDDLIEISAQGDDRNLAQNGNDRFYWYSVKDVMTLLVNTRKDHLSYNNHDTAPILGEEYSPLRQNDQKLLITDPYHQNNFASYLLDDVNKIIGDGEYTRYVWEEMPIQIIIPLLSGGHWRAIRIQINYTKKTVSILWDDPYGESAFPPKLKDTLLEAIIPNINRLIVKEVGDNEFELSLDKIVQVDKMLDQQGIGSNAWDCGPIIISNIIDYIKNLFKKNDNFQEYSISYSSSAVHEQQLIETRNTHRAQYSKTSGEFLNEDRLISIKKEESHIAKIFTHKLELSPHPYQQQIAELSPSKINILFALIESNRQSKEQAEEYSEQEVKQALEYINQHITPISLDQNYEAEYFDVNAINALLEQKKPEFNQLSFSIGTDDFVEITEQGRDFIDKSLLIKDIIETGDKVTIITRPRRWGKTTNIDMLSKFFAIKVDESGNAIDRGLHKELFQNLKIGKEYADLVAENQGQYPVIFFTFKNIKSKIFSKIESKLITELKKLYDQYAYLYNSNKLSENKKEDFKKYLNGNIEKIDIECSLEFLSSLLKEHHEKQVYIFIDEYDALLNVTYDTEEYEATLKLMRSILGQALKGNNSLKKSVVTGITKIAKAGLFSDLNNVREYSILKSRYAEYFGFTEDEVQNLLQKSKITDIRIKSAVTEYYNGYQIGDYTIYNPWSIVSFLTDLELSSYWVNTEGSVAGDRKLSTGLLMTTQMQDKVIDLINNCYAVNKDTIEIIISPEVVLHQLKDNVAAIWTVLAYGGYLSLSHRHINDDLTETYQARIPNKEVLGIYKQSISLWFKDILGINLIDLGSSTLNIENIGEFESLVRSLLLQRSEIIGDANESLFHSFIDGLFLLKGVSHRLSPEKKAGSGRIDSIYYPIKGKSNKIIIHEYKILGSTDTAQIDNKIQEALWQVYEHYYFKEVVSKYKEFNYPYYQQVEIRGIVAFIDENNHNLGMRSSSISHDISEIIDHILPFFESLKENELIKLKTHYNVNDFIKEFRKIGSFQTLLEQLSSSTVRIEDQIICELGKAVGNSVLAKRLWSEQGDNLWEMDHHKLKKLKGIGQKRATKIEELGFSLKKAKTLDKTNADLLSHNNKHLTHYEKALIDQRFSDFVSTRYQVLIDPDMQQKKVIQFYGSVALFLEHSHDLHSFNILFLIDMIKNNQITTDTVICLERKQYGNNLGMQDVLILADILKYNEVSLEKNQIFLPEYVQDFPIYYDALLYNAARGRDIKVIGIEGKGLVYSKESPYYTIAREKYMAEQLIAISQLDKKSIFVVGSFHIESIKSLFEEYKHKAKYFHLLKKIDSQFALIDTSVDQLTILDNCHNNLVITFAQVNQNRELIQNNALKFIEELPTTIWSLFESFSSKILDHPSVKFYLLNYIYEENLIDINAILVKKYITSSNIVGLIDTLQKSPLEWSKKDFRKIYLVTHPDKGGELNDFRIVQEFEQQTKSQVNLGDNLLMNALEKSIPSIQKFISKTAVSFKLFDITIDGARFIYEPSIDNIKSILLDTNYLYSMYYGVNIYSSLISSVDILQLVYREEYTQALKKLSTTAAYMMLPSLLSYTAIPHLGLVYGIGIATHSGYSAIINAYSFYLEKHNSFESILRSTIAYRDLTQTLSASPLQQIYDFASTALGYEIELNNIGLAVEKEFLKSRLIKEKGEFGQKLYDYIYKPLLEEKYNLLNQLLQGSITEEDTKTLKAKHVKISSNKQSYEHCMEIKKLKDWQDLIDNDITENAEHYYCYNTQEEILDHVSLITLDGVINNFEIMESL